VSLVTFYDNLAAHLADHENLPEITAKQVLLVTGPDDAEQIKQIDQFVKDRVMRTKGIAIVIWEGETTNEAADSQDGVMHAQVTFEVRLFVHPQKWGPTYDPTKRQARLILESLVKALNGASVAPVGRGCHDYVMVDSFLPVPDPEFWAWNVECSRTMTIK
jgi:hypothetical protein